MLTFLLTVNAEKCRIKDGSRKENGQKHTSERVVRRIDGLSLERCAETTATWRIPTVHRFDPEGLLRVDSDPTFFGPATSPSGGKYAYSRRLGKDRIACQSRHSIASQM